MRLSKFIVLILLSFSVFAQEDPDDFHKEHTFSTGDIISADAFNELFSQLELVLQSVNVEYLTGSWECKSIFSNQNELVDSAWNLHSSSLYYFLNGSQITFFDNGTGDSIITASPNPFWALDSTGFSSNYSLVANTLFLKSRPQSTNTFGYVIKKISANRFQGTLTVDNSGAGVQIIQCDRLSSVPAVPLSITITQNGSASQISWVHLSGDETGFNVYRRTGTIGEYSVIGSTGAGVSSYLDSNVNLNQLYYYRISAFNDNGESSGSKVVSVTIDDTAPFVVSTTPANGETGVGSGSCVYITFNEAVTGIHTANPVVTGGTTSNSGGSGLVTNNVAERCIQQTFTASSTYTVTLARLVRT